MLNKCKDSYEKEANLIPGWKAKSKSELITEYVKVKDTNPQLANSYISAIMLKSWSSLDKYYYGKSHTGRIYKEDCYDWLTQAVIYTTNKHIWDSPTICKKYANGQVKEKKNKLFQAPDAPNTALNRCIKSMRLGFYQSSNYDKRKLNFTTSSVDDIIDRKKDYLLPADSFDSEKINTSFAMKELIKDKFNNGKYYTAFVLEGILNGNVFDDETNDFNKKKLAHHLRTINDNYCEIISNLYDVSLDKVKEASLIYKNLNTNKMYKVIDKVINMLKETLSQDLIY